MNVISGFIILAGIRSEFISQKFFFFVSGQTLATIKEQVRLRKGALYNDIKISWRRWERQINNEQLSDGSGSIIWLCPNRKVSSLQRNWRCVCHAGWFRECLLNVKCLLGLRINTPKQSGGLSFVAINGKSGCDVWVLLLQETAGMVHRYRETPLSYI